MLLLHIQELNLEIVSFVGFISLATPNIMDEVFYLVT